MKLIHSFPKLDPSSLDILEKILKEQFDYPSLPQDYKDFLLANNGGYVSPGYIDDNKEEEHLEEVVFETPLQWAKIDNKPVTPCIFMFFTVWIESQMDENDISDWNIYELVQSNKHSRFDFDVLPKNMMSIAKCSHPDSADMLCISLDESDYGSVYYTYDMWYYPAKFHGDFYDVRKQSILDKYDFNAEEEIDLETAKGQKARFELDRVPYVKVASSFKEFLNSLKTIKVEY